VHGARAAALRGCAVMTLDAENAFNSPTRQSIRDALAADPRLTPFWRLWDLEYGGESTLLFRAHHLRSQRGTRQGTTLGPLFFAAVMQPILRALRASHPLVRAEAYLDDVTAWSESEEALRDFFLDAQERLALIGVKLKNSKCELLPGSSPPCQDLRSRLKVVSGGIRVLGAWIGAPTDPTAAWVKNKMAAHDALFQSLAALPIHVALPILRSSAVPRLSFLLRTHPPDSTVDAAGVFDESVIRTLEILLRQPLCDRSRMLARLPIRMGGLGLTEQRPLAIPSYAASLAVFTGDVVPAQEAAAAVLVEECRKTLKEDPVVHRHLQLAERAESSLWIDATDLVRPVAYGWAVRQRILAPPAAWPSILCCPGCGKSFSALDMMWHGPGCALVRGCNTKHPHDCVVDALRSVAADTGFRAISEPSLFPGQPHADRRPDLRLHVPWVLHSPESPPAMVDSVALDVTVVHALCPSVRGQGVDVLAASRARTKVTKYGAICAATTYQGRQKEPEAFVAFPVFPTGALTPQARTFCHTLAELPHCPYLPREVITRVSVAVTQGVGDVLSHISASLCRRRVGDAPPSSWVPPPPGSVPVAITLHTTVPPLSSISSPLCRRRGGVDEPFRESYSPLSVSAIFTPTQSPALTLSDPPPRLTAEAHRIDDTSR
jgi:hypothetical protein